MIYSCSHPPITNKASQFLIGRKFYPNTEKHHFSLSSYNKIFFLIIWWCLVIKMFSYIQCYSDKKCLKSKDNVASVGEINNGSLD